MDLSFSRQVGPARESFNPFRGMKTLLLSEPGVLQVSLESGGGEFLPRLGFLQVPREKESLAVFLIIPFGPVGGD